MIGCFSSLLREVVVVVHVEVVHGQPFTVKDKLVELRRVGP